MEHAYDLENIGRSEKKSLFQRNVITANTSGNLIKLNPVVLFLKKIIYFFKLIVT